MAPARRSSRRTLQPALHELLTALCAPTVALSGRDGQIRAEGAQGVFHADVRVLSAAVLTVDGCEPEPIASATRGADTVWCAALVRDAGDPGPDPTVRLDRVRRVHAGSVTETVVLRSFAGSAARLLVEIAVAADLAPVEEVKAGLRRPPLPPTPGDGENASLSWTAGDVLVVVRATGAVVRADREGAVLRWELVLPARGRLEVSWSSAMTDQGAAVVAGSGPPLWTTPDVHADDRRLAALVQAGLADLEALRMATATDPGAEFFAAGAPWYFTLFGRDSIWAARLLLPLGTAAARGTLRTLAERQGTVLDPVTGEAPGKILHELRRAGSVTANDPGQRRGGVSHADGDRPFRLPPVYYGTVDATPLWLLLLHDAWRAGLAAADVESLLDNAERALEWLAVDGPSGGTGFIDYVDAAGTGLSNQGWKDSADSVRFADGARAAAPIALCEVQGYAVAAARAGADLLDAFARPGAGRWRAYAQDLTDRFRRTFWVPDPGGDYPAIALDGGGRRVDTLTSNIGHLLATGILDEAETAAVVRRLVAAEMDSGFGLRTLSSAAVAYSPLSYHCGSVWAHDTAIVLTGMVRAGHSGAAAAFVEGLLEAGAGFDFRLPELYGGDPRAAAGSDAAVGADGAAGVPIPVPYPAACRPQAWSAAASIAVLTAILGLEVDVPRGLVRLRPMRPSPVGALQVRGLRAGDREFEVALDADGLVLAPTAESVAATGLRLVIEASTIARPTA